MIAPPILQAAAIPVQAGKVCVVTSKSGKRWTVPKGCLEPNRTPGQIALQEAWEEAGLTGVVSSKPVGSYSYEKAGSTYEVTVFLMHVTEAATHWPEVFLRRRLWLSENEAASRVEPLGLQALLRKALMTDVATAVT